MEGKRQVRGGAHLVGGAPELVIPWIFPAVDPHDGIPLGNGVVGALVWGAGDRLRVTINRADFWDRRSGLSWSADSTYANLRRMLEEGNEDGLRQAFERPQRESGSPDWTTRLPMGRIDFTIPGATLTGGSLDLHKGKASLITQMEGGARVVVLQDRPVIVVHMPGATDVAVEPVPAWEGRPDRWGLAPQTFFTETGYGPPEIFRREHCTGWTFRRPDEPALVVLCRKYAESDGGTTFLITALYGEQPEAAVARATRNLEEVHARLQVLLAGTEMWWRRYWEEGALVRLPDATLQHLYYLGLYKIGCMAMDPGPGATLQGPWVEEYRLPPWQGDYHFNVNVQECYWPVFAGNHPELAHSLFRLIDAWRPKLQQYARTFVGIEDGYMLPHAVNDRCEVVGGFWTGSIDHGSTAWVAQLMWQYWRYTRDDRFLRETAYPFMRGAMRVYEEILARDGDSYALPVSVSPEYGGNAIDAWGRNASFQLAAIHFLCRALLTAAEHLQIDDEKVEEWRAIQHRLPLFSLTPDGREIALWEGQPLQESHRHHSHLAGIFPFAILSVKAETDHGILRRSLRTWVKQGMGQWTGWCLPWAAILHARAGHGEMAELVLKLFERAFVTDGYATLHDARFPGLTVFDGRPDVMQVEAAMGFSAAVQEMLLHTDAGRLWLFPAVPAQWRDVEFSRMRAEGAFLVSARRRDGVLHSASIESLKGGRLHLVLPGPPQRVRHCQNGLETRVEVLGTEIDLEMEPGDSLELMG